MVTTQALASGTITAVSQTAGSSELIIDEKNGFIIPDITDPEASSEIIEKIICLPALKRKKNSRTCEIYNESSRWMGKLW